LQRLGSGVRDFKASAHRTRTGRGQAGRKPTAEEDGKRTEEELFGVKEQEDGPEEDDGFQTAAITRLSDRR
jgi:hypothetical protein